MKHITAGLVFAGVFVLSVPALADDSATPSTQKQNTLKECMTLQKEKDSSMSDADIKAVCKKQVHMKKSGNDLTTAPPAPAPAPDKSV